MNNSITIDIYNYNEFDLFCKKYIDNFDIIGYDIETNALDTHSIDYKVVGFSLASSSSVGCYVCLESIDFNMSSENRQLIEKRLSEILLNKQVIIYNCMHELPATLNWLDVEIPNWDDLLIMVKLMMGTATVYKGNGGLKKQAQLHLKYEDWSKDLDDYAEEIKTYKKDKENCLNKIKKILLKYYDDSEIDYVMCLVKYYAEDIIPSSKEFSYGFVPSKLIARYGSIDSSVLFDLKDFYVNWMERESKNLEIDLFKGYEYWKMHHYAGYVLERNGAYWNDDKAKVIEKWCIDGKLNALKSIIKSPLMRDYVKQNTKELYEKFLYDNYCDEMIDSNLYTIKRRYSKSIGVVPNNDDAEKFLNSMSIYPNKQGIFKLEFGNIVHMGRKFIESSNDIYDDWFSKFFDDLINGDKTLDELKKIVNPLSTHPTFRAYVSKMLITDTIRYAKAYDNIVKFTEEPSFTLEGFIDENAQYVNDCQVVSLVHKLNVSNYSKSERFDMFLEYMSKDVNFDTWRVKKLIENALDSYEFESMDAETFNTIYELYLMCHIDVENRETWNKEFEWIFNYKMFRKFDKLQSTYIEGVTARKNVYTVDKKSYSNGDILTRREDKYEHNKNLPDDKVYMLQTAFKPNIADTGRWTAGIHNLPASDAIKGIFTSRFKGGCIAMPDGSQMEVRTLSAESQDESLLQAFKDGIDIHRFFASKIYNVPYEDVQKWQRGLAKNAVFGMLYGESEQTFADTYLGGDLSRAKEVFDGMFSGFPKIKDYIDRKHKQYIDMKKITTLTQRYIDFSDSRENPDRILRQSQNYPIQASAEDIAGVILYKLIEWLRDNNMKSKPFCFIHDSIEIDMHPDEVFKILDKLDYLFNEFPLQEFGVPVACDIPLSMSMGAEIEVKSLKCKNDYNDVEIILSGFEDDIDELIDNWLDTYKSVKIDYKYVSSEPDKDIYMPIAERFLPKKAPVSMKQGTYRKNIERKFYITVK